MKRWIPRVALIILASGLVATVLPGIKAQRVVEVRAPDRGSLTVAAFVALAILRLFVTLDRRARTHRTSP